MVNTSRIISITHLGGGSGVTSSTLIYSRMQSKTKAKQNKKYLLHLEELFDSGIIDMKECLKSTSHMIGKMSSRNEGQAEVLDGVRILTYQSEQH